MVNTKPHLWLNANFLFPFVHRTTRCKKVKLVWRRTAAYHSGHFSFHSSLCSHKGLQEPTTSRQLNRNRRPPIGVPLPSLFSVFLYVRFQLCVGAPCRAGVPGVLPKCHPGSFRQCGLT